MSCDHVTGWNPYGGGWPARLHVKSEPDCHPRTSVMFNWCPLCGEPLTEDAKDFIPPEPYRRLPDRVDCDHCDAMYCYCTCSTCETRRKASYDEAATFRSCQPTERISVDVAEFEALKKSAERRSKWKWWWPGSPTW